MNIESIVRKPLLRALLESRTVNSVDVREIQFKPSQQTGVHKHRCPVLGYIASGGAILEVKGHPPQLLPQGSAFHEPADATILRFDNASETEPLTFIAYYLLEADEPLIQMLPDENS